MTGRANLRVFRIVYRHFLVTLCVALRLRLLYFRMVTKVVFMKGDREDGVRLRRATSRVPFTPRYRRLRCAILDAIIEIFNASFALYGPSKLVLFSSYVIRVAKRTNEQLGRLPRNRYALRSG